MEYYASTENSVRKEDFMKQRQVYDRGFKKGGRLKSNVQTEQQYTGHQFHLKTMKIGRFLQKHV